MFWKWFGITGIQEEGILGSIALESEACHTQMAYEYVHACGDVFEIIIFNKAAWVYDEGCPSSVGYAFQYRIYSYTGNTFV
jgi:hypothetical protein